MTAYIVFTDTDPLTAERRHDIPIPILFGQVWVCEAPPTSPAAQGED